MQNYIVKLMNFDIEAQTLDVVFWLEQRWYDPRLVWNPNDYGGLKTIKVKPSSVWTPDIVLYNSAEARYQMTDDLSNAVNINLFSNGVVRWTPILKVTLSCPLNLAYFPFDYQTCYMKLGSWSMTYDRLKFHQLKNTSSVYYYEHSHTWDLVANFATNNIIQYENGAWQDLKYIFTFARNPNQYIINIIITCSFLVLVSGLTFIVPCESGERLSAVLAIVVAISVYQMVAMDIIPKGADSLPILSYFVAMQLYVVFYCAMVTMFCLWVQSGQHSSRPNRWLFYLFVFILGRVVRIKNTEVYKTLKEKYGWMEVTDEEDLVERKNLEWGCLELSVERLSVVLYWVVFLVSIIVVFVFDGKRGNQMQGEFDKLFTEGTGLAFQ